MYWKVQIFVCDCIESQEEILVVVVPRYLPSVCKQLVAADHHLFPVSGEAEPRFDHIHSELGAGQSYAAAPEAAQRERAWVVLF